MEDKLKDKLREALEGEVKVLYSAVVLTEEAHSKLVTTLQSDIPEGWKLFAHHMTIIFGQGLPEEQKVNLGKTVKLTATHLGQSGMAIAVGVTGYPSNNEKPHITVAVNVAEGGKPFMSNKIEEWLPLSQPIELSGVVTEIKAN